MMKGAKQVEWKDYGVKGNSFTCSTSRSLTILLFQLSSV